MSISFDDVITVMALIAALNAGMRVRFGSEAFQKVYHAVCATGLVITLILTAYWVLVRGTL
jgi:hypothetical protein